MQTNSPPKSPPSPFELALEFAKRLNEFLTPEQMDEVRRRNAQMVGDSCCASHDFCDANVAMLEAMENFGLEFDPASTPQTNLINQAWSMAKVVGFQVSVLEGEPPKDRPSSPRP